MNQSIGTTGLILNEPLIWEKSVPGREGFSIPDCDVPQTQLDSLLLGETPPLPDLSEVDVVRHFTRLSTWNFGVDTGVYALGSCTMKYNPKTNERQAELPGFQYSHPMLPNKLAQGILRLMYDLQTYLIEITGLDAVTLQPSAGAHGELCGMLIFEAYHRSQNSRRHKIIIPDTAHGTNPASAARCGYEPVKATSDPNGVLSVESIDNLMDEDTAGIMLTNPNTLGLFEKNIREIAQIIHNKGGLVYCDGANMNAVMGVVHMGRMGVDVLHLNLHKTFSTPHGGGGPGSGPVCVVKRLAPFLPIPRVVKNKNIYELSSHFPQSIGRLHSFYGNVGVMIKAFAYIVSMGPENLTKASQLAVLNANYLKEQLKEHLHLPYDKPCMHECVFSDEQQKKFKISTLDIVKRLIDYGFHPPTIYFPLIVPGAIMMEPTETESKTDLDQFIEAIKAIIKEGEVSPDKLLNAPHNTKVCRLDETMAARKPCLIG